MDNIDYLLTQGFSLDELESLRQKNDFSYDEMAQAVQAIVDRGENPREAFGPFGPFVTENQDWEIPIPFDEPNTPPFPTKCLPGPMAAFVEALAENTQTPTEMAGILSLGVLATAFQSKVMVQVTPDWKEPLCLFTVAVAPPGERKSAVISSLTKPIIEFEAEQRDIEREEIAQNRTERDLLEKQLERAKNAAASGKGDFAAKRAEALELSAQLANFDDLHPFRLLADDSTPEKLIELMDAQNGSISVSSAEGGVFDTMAGRYDSKANFDVYLKGHAGDSITVDRIGRKTNHIPNPRLTMLLTIQPEVLSGLMSNSSFKGRGLCGRFLYAVCKSKVGHRDVCPAPIPDDVKANYRAFVRRILSSQWSGVITLSPEADAIRVKYQEYIEKKLGGTWDCMRDWGGKVTGAMVRIAALIHAAEAPTSTPITAETMAAATTIAEFLSSHAEAAYGLMGADEGQENARYLWRRLESAGVDEISKRDLYRLCKGKFRRVDEMDPALQTLIDMGYLRAAEVSTGGRPTLKLFVNPCDKRAKRDKSGVMSDGQ